MVDSESPLTMDKINEELDEIILQFFDTLESRMQLQANLDEQLKSGFLQMSRARYNMGIKAIGASQFNEKEMASLYSVDVVDDNGSTNNKFLLNQQVLVDNKIDKNRQMEQTSIDKNNMSGLRKRNVCQQSEQTEKDSDDNKTVEVETLGQRLNTEEVKVDNQAADNNNEKAGTISKQDPLKWFGVLVPQSLRQSQSNFKQSVNTAVQIVNIQEKLLRLKEQYVELMKEKTASS